MNPVDVVYRKMAVDLKTIEDNIREIKQKQAIGSDSVHIYRNRTGSTWDVNWTPTWVAPQTTALRNYSVIFQSDTQDAPFSEFTLYALINDTYEYIIARVNIGQNGVWFNSILKDYFLTYSSFTPGPGKMGWYFAVASYVSGTNIKIRFQVDSTDTGAITFAVI